MPWLVALPGWWLLPDEVAWSNTSQPQDPPWTKQTFWQQEPIQAFQILTTHNLTETGAQGNLCPPVTWIVADFKLLHCLLAAKAAA